MSIDETTRRRPHQLCDHQFVYILRGDGDLWIDDKRFDVAPDQLYLILPGSWYLFRVAAGQSYDFVSVHFDWRAEEDGERRPNYRVEGEPLPGFPKREYLPDWPAETRPYLDLRGRPRVRRLMEEIADGFRSWDRLAYVESAGLLVAAFGRIVREARALALVERYETVGADAVRRVERARLLLETLQTPPVSIDDAAAAAGWSADHLRRMFQTVLGTSPQKLHRSAQVAKARELLREDSLPIHEIAEACGFDDQAYFGRVFKAETGFTPSQYRLRVRA